MTLAVHSSGHVAVPPPSRRGLSRVEAAEYVGISPSKFDQLVADGRMPRPVRIDGRRIWDARRVDAAFDALAAVEDDVGAADPTWSDVDAFSQATASR